VNTALMCMAMALYFEARSEPEMEQRKVAEVIMNRVNSPRYPMDVCGVVKQDKGSGDHDCQFSFYCDGKKEIIDDPEAFERVLGIGIDVLTRAQQPLLPEDALWYHADYVSPVWATRLERVSAEGSHIFYTPKVSD
jgi:spore germination cell wall hydrolase CwlJ-like protein